MYKHAQGQSGPYLEDTPPNSLIQYNHTATHPTPPTKPSISSAGLSFLFVNDWHIEITRPH